MTSGGSTFIDFLENQLTKFRAVLTVLRQIGTTRSFVQSKMFLFHFPQLFLGSTLLPPVIEVDAPGQCRMKLGAIDAAALGLFKT